MNTRILLEDSGSCWRSRKTPGGGDLHYAGTVIAGGDLRPDGKALTLLFEGADILDAGEVERLLAGLDGFFSLIFENERGLLMAVDRVRTCPLFFGDRAGSFLVSDSAQSLERELGPGRQNNPGVLELLLCGYVTGNETLYEGLRQLLPGQYLVLDREEGRSRIGEYYRYYPEEPPGGSVSIESKLEEYRSIIDGSFTRLSGFIREMGLRPVIPLSGGLDSRLIAVMIEEAGFADALCYTFGTGDHGEVARSRKVAGELGLEWRFEPYSKERWRDEYGSPIAARYLGFAGNLSVKPHLMEFIAVRSLFGDRVAERLLFLPGHSLDFIAGSHIPPILAVTARPGAGDLHSSILSRHFCFHRVYPPERDLVLERISRELGRLPLRGKSELIAAFEYWDWRERQGKLITNSLKVYDFFGFARYMPFFETDWMDFFMSIPFSWRYMQNFHRLAMRRFFPSFYGEQEWVPARWSPRWELIGMVRRHPALEGLRDVMTGYQRKKLSWDYGLNRFGVFDPGADSLDEFAAKYSRRTGIRHIFYLFALDFLRRNEIDLGFLGERYLTSLPMPPRG